MILFLLFPHGTGRGHNGNPSTLQRSAKAKGLIGDAYAQHRPLYTTTLQGASLFQCRVKRGQSAGHRHTCFHPRDFFLQVRYCYTEGRIVKFRPALRIVVVPRNAQQQPPRLDAGGCAAKTRRNSSRSAVAVASRLRLGHWVGVADGL